LRGLWVIGADHSRRTLEAGCDDAPIMRNTNPFQFFMAVKGWHSMAVRVTVLKKEVVLRHCVVYFVAGLGMARKSGALRVSLSP